MLTFGTSCLFARLVTSATPVPHFIRTLVGYRSKAHFPLMIKDYSYQRLIAGCFINAELCFKLSCLRFVFSD